MCDYSLHNVRNRLAVEGEPLQVHRFPSNSLGLASPADLRPTTTASSVKTIANWWREVKSWFRESPAVAAICVPPGARLVLRDIPQVLQDIYAISAEEEVTFVQKSPETFGYRDAVRFYNGEEILIQRLPVGLHLEVLGLLAHEEEPEQCMPIRSREVLASD